MPKLELTIKTPISDDEIKQSSAELKKRQDKLPLLEVYAHVRHKTLDDIMARRAEQITRQQEQAASQASRNAVLQSEDEHLQNLANALQAVASETIAWVQNAYASMDETQQALSTLPKKKQELSETLQRRSSSLIKKQKSPTKNDEKTQEELIKTQQKKLSQINIGLRKQYGKAEAVIEAFELRWAQIEGMNAQLPLLEKGLGRAGIEPDESSLVGIALWEKTLEILDPTANQWLKQLDKQISQRSKLISSYSNEIVEESNEHLSGQIRETTEMNRLSKATKKADKAAKAQDEKLKKVERQGKTAPPEDQEKKKHFGEQMESAHKAEAELKKERESTYERAWGKSVGSNLARHERAQQQARKFRTYWKKNEATISSQIKNLAKRKRELLDNPTQLNAEIRRLQTLLSDIRKALVPEAGLKTERTFEEVTALSFQKRLYTIPNAREDNEITGIGVKDTPLPERRPYATANAREGIHGKIEGIDDDGAVFIRSAKYIPDKERKGGLRNPEFIKVPIDLWPPSVDRTVGRSVHFAANDRALGTTPILISGVVQGATPKGDLIVKQTRGSANIAIPAELLPPGREFPLGEDVKFFTQGDIPVKGASQMISGWVYDRLADGALIVSDKNWGLIKIPALNQPERIANDADIIGKNVDFLTTLRFDFSQPVVPEGVNNDTPLNFSTQSQDEISVLDSSSSGQGSSLPPSSPTLNQKTGKAMQRSEAAIARWTASNYLWSKLSSAQKEELFAMIKQNQSAGRDAPTQENTLLETVKTGVNIQVNKGHVFMQTDIDGVNMTFIKIQSAQEETKITVAPTKQLHNRLENGNIVVGKLFTGTIGDAPKITSPSTSRKIN